MKNQQKLEPKSNIQKSNTEKSSHHLQLIERHTTIENQHSNSSNIIIEAISSVVPLWVLLLMKPQRFTIFLLASSAHDSRWKLISHWEEYCWKIRLSFIVVVRLSPFTCATATSTMAEQFVDLSTKPQEKLNFRLSTFFQRKSLFQCELPDVLVEDYQFDFDEFNPRKINPLSVSEPLHHEWWA